MTILPYIPSFYVDLPKIADVPSAWRGLERIIYDIVARFNVPQKSALEFGVEHGYSASALANVFETVVGVDTFTGDIHSGYHSDEMEQTKTRIAAFPNIFLVRARYEDYTLFDEGQYDLIHVDIVHHYLPTFACGRWAANHARVVLFHDTQSFPEVKQAVKDIALETGMAFYNYEPCHGLGILVRK